MLHSSPRRPPPPTSMMGWLLWCIHRVLLPLALCGAAALILLALAWRLLRNRLPRWINHVTGLQVVLNPRLALRVHSVGLTSAAFERRGGRLCWVVKGVRASLRLREGPLPKGKGRGGGRQGRQQHGDEDASLAHDDAAEHLKLVSLASGASWFVQIGSRFHPLWRVLAPWLRLSTPFLPLLRSLALIVEDGSVELAFAGDATPGGGGAGNGGQSLLLRIDALAIHARPQTAAEAEIAGGERGVAVEIVLGREAAAAAAEGEKGGDATQTTRGSSSSTPLLVLRDGVGDDPLEHAAVPAPAPPLVEVEGGLRVSLDVPWPPRLTTAAPRPKPGQQPQQPRQPQGPTAATTAAGVGFAYLTRPPLLPRMVHVRMGRAVRVTVGERHAGLAARALAFLLEGAQDGGGGGEGAIQAEEQEEVEGGAGHKGRPTMTPLLRQYLETFEERYSGLPDLLLSTEWTQAAVDCPRLELRVALPPQPDGGGGGYDALLEVKGLAARTSQTAVEADRVSTLYRLGLEEGAALRLLSRDRSVVAATAPAVVALGNVEAEVGVELTYALQMTSRRLMPVLLLSYAVAAETRVESLAVAADAAVARALLPLLPAPPAPPASASASVASPKRQQQRQQPQQRRRKEGSSGGGGGTTTRVSLSVSILCPSLSVAYSATTTTDDDGEEDGGGSYRYRAACALEGVSLEAHPLDDDEQEGAAKLLKVGARRLAVDVEMGKAGPEVEEGEEANAIACPLVRARGLGVVSRSGGGGDGGGGAGKEVEKEDAAVSLDLAELGLEWNPLAVVGLAALLRASVPAPPAWGPSSTMASPAGEDVEEEQEQGPGAAPALPPPPPQPLTAALAARALDGAIDDEEDDEQWEGIEWAPGQRPRARERAVAPRGRRRRALVGETRLVTVHFPYAMSQGLGDLRPAEAWAWAVARRAAQAAVASEPSAAWGLEVVRVARAGFRAELEGGDEEEEEDKAAGPRWCFTVADCAVSHERDAGSSGGGEDEAGGTTSSSSGGKSPPYCVVRRFATRQRGAGLIDVCARGVRIPGWTPAQQLRVLRVCQDVTLSVWAALLHGRELLDPQPPGFTVNAPLDDAAACRRMLGQWAAGLVGSAKGPVRHRLHATDIVLEAAVPTMTAAPPGDGGAEEGPQQPPPPLRLRVAVGLFASEDMPSLWTFGEVAVSSLAPEAAAGEGEKEEEPVQGPPPPFFALRHARIRQTVDGRDDVASGEFVQELRVRRRLVAAAAAAASHTAPDNDEEEEAEQRLLASLAPARRALLTGKDGQRVELRAVLLRLDPAAVPYAALLAAAPSLALGMAAAFAEAPARWVPTPGGAPAFARRFKRPTYRRALSAEEDGLGSLRVWLHAENCSVEAAHPDDPLAGWLAAHAPLRRRFLSGRAARRTQADRRLEQLLRTSASGAAADPEALRAAMEGRLAELDARLYVEAVRRHRRRRLGRGRFGGGCLLLRAHVQAAALAVEAASAAEAGALVAGFGFARPHGEARGLRLGPLCVQGVTAVLHPPPASGGASAEEEQGESAAGAPPPLVALESLRLQGTVAVGLPPARTPAQAAAAAAPPPTPVVFSDADGPAAATACRAQLRWPNTALLPVLGLDLRARLDGLAVAAAASAGVGAAGAELVALVARLLPPLPAAPLGEGDASLPWWDALRAHIGVRVRAACTRSTLALLAPPEPELSAAEAAAPLLPPSLSPDRVGSTTASLGGGSSLGGSRTPSPNKRQQSQKQRSPLGASAASASSLLGPSLIGGPRDATTPPGVAPSPAVEYAVEGLRVEVPLVALRYGAARADVDVAGARVLPTTSTATMDGMMTPLVQLPHLRAGVALAWAEGQGQGQEEEDAGGRSTGLRVRVEGRVAPLDNAAATSVPALLALLAAAAAEEEEKEEEDDEGLRLHLLAAPRATTLSVHPHLLPGLAAFARRAARAATAPRAALPRQRGAGLFARAVARLGGHVRGLNVGPVEVEGLRVLVHDWRGDAAAAPALVLAVKGAVAASLCVVEEEAAEGVAVVVPDPFATGRLLLRAAAAAGPFWTLRGARVEVTAVECRVRMAGGTGGRDDGGPEGGGGEPLLALGSLVYHQQEQQQVDAPSASSPFFLHRILCDDLRCLVTPKGRDALLSLAQAYHTAARPFLTALPSTFSSPATTTTTTTTTTTPPPHQAPLPQPPPPPAATHPLFALEARRVQAQVLDRRRRACAILALDALRVESRVGGLTQDSTSDNSTTTKHLALQRLAARASPGGFVERLACRVPAAALLVAPTDVDVGLGLVWLPPTAFAALVPTRPEDAPASDLGVLRPVLHPLPLTATVEATHLHAATSGGGGGGGAGDRHAVSLALPRLLRVALDGDHLRLLIAALERLAAPPPPSLLPTTSSTAPSTAPPSPNPRTARGTEPPLVAAAASSATTGATSSSAAAAASLLLPSVPTPPGPLSPARVGGSAARRVSKDGVGAAAVTAGAAEAGSVSLEAVAAERRRQQWAHRAAALVLDAVRPVVLGPEAERGDGERDGDGEENEDDDPAALAAAFAVLADFARVTLGVGASEAASATFPGAAAAGGFGLGEWVEAWALDLEEAAAAARARGGALTAELGALWEEVRGRARPRPRVEVAVAVKGVLVTLKQLQRPFIRGGMRGVKATFARLEDGSARGRVDVGGLGVEDVGTSGSGSGSGGSTAAGAGGGSAAVGGAASGAAAAAAVAATAPVLFPVGAAPEEWPAVGEEGEEGEDAAAATEGEALLHLQAEMGPPVGGLTILRHVEANCAPLNLQLTRGLVVQLYDYIQPLVAAAAGEQREGEGAGGGVGGGGGSRASSSGAASPQAGPSPRAALLGVKHHKRQATKEAAAAAAEAEAEAGGGKEKGHRSRGPSSVMSFFTSGHHSSGAQQQQQQQQQSAPEAAAEQLMRARAARNLVFKHFRLGEVNVYFSYAGAKWRNLEDVDQLHLKLHPIVYRNKTYSAREFALRLRRDVVKDLLSQVNRNFQNLGAFLKQGVAGLFLTGGDADGRGGGYADDADGEDSDADGSGWGRPDMSASAGGGGAGGVGLEAGMVSGVDGGVPKPLTLAATPTRRTGPAIAMATAPVQHAPPPKPPRPQHAVAAALDASSGSSGAGAADVGMLPPLQPPLSPVKVVREASGARLPSSSPVSPSSSSLPASPGRRLSPPVSPPSSLSPQRNVVTTAAPVTGEAEQQAEGSVVQGQQQQQQQEEETLLWSRSGGAGGGGGPRGDPLSASSSTSSSAAAPVAPASRERGASLLFGGGPSAPPPQQQPPPSQQSQEDASKKLLFGGRDGSGGGGLAAKWGKKFKK